MDPQLEIVLRLGAAILSGGVIGLNRDLYGKPTGVRMHALVALGSAVVIVAGAGDPTNVTRIVQGIVSGIGFLGAGVIIHSGGLGGRPSEEPVAIRHLTTAASIWVTAGLGVACGLGMWTLAVAGTLGVLALLYVGTRIDRALFRRLGDEWRPGKPPDP